MCNFIRYSIEKFANQRNALSFDFITFYRIVSAIQFDEMNSRSKYNRVKVILSLHLRR